MYTRFFGFKERPFKLVPNPAYLYLSKGHEEALAHLQCAVVHEDGFVAITGEVGTVTTATVAKVGDIFTIFFGSCFGRCSDRLNRLPRALCLDHSQRDKGRKDG